MQANQFDLIIIGAGCVGMAAAYYALKSGKKVCIVESQTIGSTERYWSSSFSARQNRVQYNEEYLTRYVLESNKEWKAVEEDLQSFNDSGRKFLSEEGALWFGDKNTSTSEGNIKAANAVIGMINSSARTKEERVESLYMEKLMQGSPDFMRAFKPNDVPNSATSEWDTWSALYQPNGGSVDMEASYVAFAKFVKTKGATVYDNSAVVDYKTTQLWETFNIKRGGATQPTLIQGKKVFISVGVYAPQFLRDIMKEPYLADNHKNEYVIQEYVASFMKIEQKDNNVSVYSNLPNYYNFLEETKNIQGKVNEFSGYGFRFHSWDNLGQTESKFVKLGTMACVDFENGQVPPNLSYKPIENLKDPRIEAAVNFATNRMNGLLPNDPKNKHYPCPILFYSSRETLIDYLNRTNERIVIQSGGWVGKYYPLLAKTAIMMLEDPQKTNKLRADDSSIIGNFINRTRFPITSRVNAVLKSWVEPTTKLLKNTHFKTAIIGAGCSGLYAAYRLNNEKKTSKARSAEIGNIGVFELSDRISGRLKSFKFTNTTTPMELGGMRYIPTNHVLVNEIITDLGIPHLKFSMRGDPIQNAARMAFLRNDYYRMNEWDATQNAGHNLITSYRIQGPITGMDSFQIISYSLYLILTAKENLRILEEVFLVKTDAEIADQKYRLGLLGENVHVQNSWYRDWKNYIYQDKQHPKVYATGMTLKQWNDIKPILVYRHRNQVNQDHFEKEIGKVYPLYKFGFQNVIEAQFGHEAYEFVAQQNGYFSNTSNASYLDQVMTYVLDFGNVQYRTLASGFDQINYGMANILIDKKLGLDPVNEGIFLNHKLVDIVKETSGVYTLVFHVALKDELRQKYCKAGLNLCKIFKLLKNDKKEYGKLLKIEGNDNEARVMYTADRIICGMPKKSITLLYNEIDLLQTEFTANYLSIYNSLKEQFYQFFKFLKLQELITKGQGLSDLTASQTALLKVLRQRQQEYFDTGKNPLTENEAETLNELSETEFLKSLQPLTVSQSTFQNGKRPLFESDQPITPKNLNRLADSTQLMPAMKIVMNFDRSWWDPNIRINKEYQQTYKNTNLISSVEEMRGVSVTDLPARQTLYFTSGQDNLLLASYNDMITTEFWTTLHDNFSKVWQPINVGYKRDYFLNKKNKAVVGKSNYPQSMDIHPAKEVLVREILKELSLMHQIQIKQEWVKECVYQFWGTDPYGAGYHNFYSGFYIPAVMRTMRKPWATEKIHFVGEAFSNETGWVQGAFQTTELLLQQQMKVSQLVPGYYAGY